LLITFFDFEVLINNNQSILRVITNNYKLRTMKQIIKITAVLALIISLASCQSSKSGCYDFSEMNSKVINDNRTDSKSDLIFTSVVCKP